MKTEREVIDAALEYAEEIFRTESAKRMAERRHAFMKEFVDEFLEEWDGRR